MFFYQIKVIQFILVLLRNAYKIYFKHLTTPLTKHERCKNNRAMINVQYMVCSYKHNLKRSITTGTKHRSKLPNLLQ